ncbi:hypothetical protein [Streptomyces longwoodensis]|uniref:hypothetical protein n=1 Tax=Streptomyces longwoodensis TaxID=68231 RepID=UPI0036F69B30
MTRRDFQAIADAVAEARRWTDDTNTEALDALGAVARQLAAACARQYRGGYGFNRPRFLEACGFPEH